MGTIVERRRKDGSKAFTAQIVLKKGGKIVRREAETFDRRRAADAWPPLFDSGYDFGEADKRHLGLFQFSTGYSSKNGFGPVALASASMRTRGENGFSRQATQPSSIAWRRHDGSVDPLMKIAGSFKPPASNWRTSSIPLISGRSISTMRQAGVSSRLAERRCSALS